MWLSFLFFATLIVLAGTQLTKNAEKVAAGFGLSGAWAGALLLPLATTLPELVVSRRAAIIGSPDLAGGNIYGSILFNLTLIASIDLVQGRGPLTSRSKRGLVITALLSITAITFSILGILLALPFHLGWVGYDTVVLLLIYLVGSRMIMGVERRREEDYRKEVKRKGEKRSELLRGLTFFALAAGVIIFAGTGLTDVSERIAQETGLGRTLIGSLFIAITTSLPEVVTTTTAVRLGYVEMAVANVFGANFFNILLLFFTDVFYRQGPLLRELAFPNVIAGVMAIILTLVAVINLLYPLRTRFLRMGWPSILVICGYLLTFAFLFYFK